ncbi:DUF421 domain-containing protein [Sporosarcina sp. ACRSL]|uniref:DUF421 domain-containing protein n=1 Tax=Sporosarcina sp. ACRSL TaxID=2918215 RepID=UPI001EF4FC84|nr:DUF421 domain-containing protein [Sporosarcina sp. ACRSL]MCG7345469.1 DUF421 domain-containing protein [Sporosarcina sp. ACRSL]
MAFFYGQETLTAIQWVLRAIIGFFFLLFATKLMGERSISQLRLIDLTIALIIGNTLAHPLSDEKLGMKGALISTAVLIILYITTVYATLKWGNLRKLMEPSPYPLIKNGELILPNLKKARITIDHLLSELRKEQIKDIQKVALALWEPDGTISFFLSPQHLPVTPKDLQLTTNPFSFPIVIVKEGKIDMDSLKSVGKDMKWLQTKFTHYNVQASDILLATVDDSDDVKIYRCKG